MHKTFEHPHNSAPMNLLVVGINHKTAPIQIREKFHLPEHEQRLLLAAFKSDPRIWGGFILSTCNRTEMYVQIMDHAPEILFDLIAKVKRVNIDAHTKEYFYILKDREVAEHFLRVSTGLDSLVLGEKQILGQIKKAVDLSRGEGMMSKTLNVLTHVAIRAGKKAQTETQIGCGGSSVSWAAVAMAQKSFGSLKDKSVLIIGTGKMGHLAANYLSKKNAGHIYVLNRTTEKAQELARQIGATLVPYWDMMAVLEKVDVCICSSSAPHYLIEKALIEKVMSLRPSRKLLCIDISMPRNIDPEVSSVYNASLIAIDDLDKIVEESREKRQTAMGDVEKIIARKAVEFYMKLSKTIAVQAPQYLAADCPY